METKRELIPVNRSFNKPTLVSGIDWRLFMMCLFASAVIFLFVSKIGAILFFAAILLMARWMTKHDLQMPFLWLLSFLQSSYYDPGKR